MNEREMEIIVNNPMNPMFSRQHRYLNYIVHKKGRETKAKEMKWQVEMRWMSARQQQTCNFYRLTPEGNSMCFS